MYRAPALQVATSSRLTTTVGASNFSDRRRVSTARAPDVGTSRERTALYRIGSEVGAASRAAPGTYFRRRSRGLIENGPPGKGRGGSGRERRKKVARGCPTEIARAPGHL